MSSRYVKNGLWYCYLFILAVLGCYVSVFLLGEVSATRTMNGTPCMELAALGAFLGLLVSRLTKRSWIPALLLAVGTGIWVYIKYEAAAGGMVYIVNNLIETINDYYSGNLYYISPSQEMLLEADQQLFLNILCFFGGCFYVLLFYWKSCIWLPAIFSLAAFWIPLSLEMPVNSLMFLLQVVFICGSFAIRENKKNNLANVQTGILLPALAMAVMGITSLINPGETYIRSSFFDDIRGKYVFSIADFQYMSFDLENFRLRMTASGDIQNGISGGSLGQTARISYTGEAVLEVTAPSDMGTFYLKGYQAEVYTSTQWEQLDNSIYAGEQELFSERETLQTLTEELIKRLANVDDADVGYLNYNITVRKLLENDSYDYVPYGVELIRPGNSQITWDYEQDGIISINGENTEDAISFQVLDWNNHTSLRAAARLSQHLYERGNIDRQWAELYDLEEEYRGFVYDNYMEVNTPSADQIKEELLPEIQSENYNLEEVDGKLEFIEDVVRFFDENYRYTLNPGITPSSRDFIDYFLFTSKRGYCTYFASSAVMIFRSAGIPARYVEGYVIRDELFGTGEQTEMEFQGTAAGENLSEPHTMERILVTDEYAHAWVEVYLDQFGWVVVDPTPGSSGSVNYTGLFDEIPEETEEIEETDESQEETDESETEETTTEEGMEVPEDSRDSEDSQSTEETTAQGLGIGTDGEGGATNSFMEILSGIGKILLTVAEILFIPVLLLGILIFRQKTMEEKRKKLYNESCGLSRKKRVGKILAYYEKLMSFEKLPMKTSESYEEYRERLRTYPMSQRTEGMCDGAFQVIIRTVYSENAVEEADVLQLMEYVYATREDIYEKQSTMKKLYLKYILAL